MTFELTKKHFRNSKKCFVEIKVELAPRVMRKIKSWVMLEESAWANRIRCEFIFSLDRLLRFRYRSIDNGFKLINNN